MYSKGSEIIEILCGTFADRYSPLTRAEFWKLYHQYEDSVEKMAGSEDERIVKLLERRGAMAFAKEQMIQMGISIVTFQDDEFPLRLREKLGDFCPPLLYCCGRDSVLNNKFVGYVGSRSINEEDASWTEERVKENIRDGYGVVTGGANGIDSVALNSALNMGGKVLVFLPDNIKEKLRDSFVRQYIEQGDLYVSSHVSPFAGKSRNSFVAAAMERNKFIYAMSNGTVVVRSDLKKGGTWSGAVETLKHRWAPVFVWDNKKYPGNQELISMGGRALSDDGSLVKTANREGACQGEKKSGPDGAEETGQTEMRQMTLFDLMKQTADT